MLHLDPGIHLDEVEVVRVGVHQELHGAGVLVAHLVPDGHRRVAQRLPNVRIQLRRGRNLDHLLVAPLDRAVALVQVHQVAVLVAQQLDLDVPGAFHELLDERLGVPEGGERLPACLLEGVGELGGLAHDPHAPSPAAVGRLQDHRESDLFGQATSFLLVPDRLLAAAHHRHPGALGDGPRRHLVAQLLQRLHPGSHEDDPRVLARLRQVRVLRQEPVARVNGVHTVALRQRHDGLHVEVGLDRLARRADLVGFVRLGAVQGEPVLVRVDRHGPNTEFVGAPEDPDRDFASVGDEQAADFSHSVVWT